MLPIHATYPEVKEKIARLTADYQRAPDSVRLIAVSKQHAASKVAELARLGQCDFAENYVQESISKIAHVRELLAPYPIQPLCWHFIGHIQSRKCNLITENFSWVHTIARIKVADKLNQCRAGREPLNVLIQLNLQGEESKFGVSEAELLPLAKTIIALPNLRLRGVMIIPQPEAKFSQQRAVFARCRELRDALRSELNSSSTAPHSTLDHLSMGMSADMEAALAEGTTMLRLGTAIFGARAPKKSGGSI